MAWLILLLLLWTSPAQAVDGVIEINQASVLAAGGFPFALTGGSYRLTSDLIVSDPDDSAIRINSSGTTLDLNGFAIRGVTACAGIPPNCSNTGAGVGVVVNGGPSRVRVHNGSIVGMGSHGVELAGGCVVEDLQVRGCGGDGIHVNSVCTLRNNQISVVGGDGIETGFSNAGVLVTGNVIDIAGGLGLRLGNAHVYSGNVITRSNGGTGNPQVLGGQEIGENFCDTNTVCP